MGDSDMSEDENVIYEPSGLSQTQRKELISGRSKRLDEVMNGSIDGRRLKKTIALCGAFVGLGLSIAVTGPTLQELQDHLNTDLPQISFLFTGRSIGYVVGSIVGGFFFERLPPFILVAVTLAVSGIGLLIMPHFEQLGPAVFIISFAGLGNGALDTGANVIVLRLWGKKSSPFIQALHFSFALGAFISPLLASPFIGTTNRTLTSTATTHAPGNITSLSILNSSVTPTPVLATGHVSNADVANFTFNIAEVATPLPDLTTVKGDTTTLPDLTTAKGDATTLPDLTTAKGDATTLPDLTTFKGDGSDTNISTTTINDADETGSYKKRFAELDFELQVHDDDTVDHNRISKRNSRRRIERKTSKAKAKSEVHPHKKGKKVTPTSEPGSEPTAAPNKRSTTTVSDSVPTSACSATSNVTQVETATSYFVPHRDRFQGVYTIIGIFLVLMAMISIYFHRTSPRQLPHLASFNYQTDLETGKLPKHEKDFTNYILGLLFVFYVLYVGAEVGYGGYIYTFAISVSLKPKSAAHLNALFWGSFATMRGVSIFISSLISPLNMLVVDFLGCIMSSLVLSFDGSTNRTVLWVGTVVLGASMASLFPSGVSWLESYTRVTGKMASLLVVGSACGQMAIPLILGHLFGTIGPVSLMYLMCIISLLSALIFGYAVYLAASRGKDFEGPLPEDEMPAVQISQDVQDEISLPNVKIAKLGINSGQVQKTVLTKKSHKE